MHVLLVAGFLGSGKTTAIIALARAIVAHDLKIALVVNEVGEVGLDDQVLAHQGLDVRELLSGCICCSLAGDLLETLEKLEDSQVVDLVIVEPSGAASPEPIIQLLREHTSRFADSLRTAVVIDPLRLGELMAVLEPLISAQIRLADTILISRRDLASVEEISRAKATARRLNEKATLLPVALTAGTSPAMVKELLPWLN